MLELVLDGNTETRTNRALALSANMIRVESGGLNRKTIYDVTYKLDDYKAWPKWMPNKAKFYEALALSHCEKALGSSEEDVFCECCCELRQLLDAIEDVRARIEVIESILDHLAHNVDQLTGDEPSGWDAVAAVCVELLAGLAPHGRHVLTVVWDFLARPLLAGSVGRVPKLCKAVSCWPEPPPENRDCRRLYEEIQKVRQNLEANDS